jgi:hypothetical protein
MAISNHGRHGEPGSAKVVRCPYCVEGSGFRTMTSEGSTGGDWLICERCGHLSLLTNPQFERTCVKCVRVRFSKPSPFAD